VGIEDRPRSVSRIRDGRAWRIATAAEVAWIRDGTSVTRAITAAIPPVFDAYATLELPGASSDQAWSADAQRRHDDALLALLSRYAPPQPWWLGYLDTGTDDIVFPDATDGAGRCRLSERHRTIVLGRVPHHFPRHVMSGERRLSDAVALVGSTTNGGVGAIRRLLHASPGGPDGAVRLRLPNPSFWARDARPARHTPLQGSRQGAPSPGPDRPSSPEARRTCW